MKMHLHVKDDLNYASHLTANIKAHNVFNVCGLFKFILIVISHLPQNSYICFRLTEIETSENNSSRHGYFAGGSNDRLQLPGLFVERQKG